MLFKTLFLAAVLSLQGPNPYFAFRIALTGQQATKALLAQLSNQSEVVCTSDAAYDTDFTPRYNIAGPPSYQIAVKPALVDDVQKIVSRLSQNSNGMPAFPSRDILLPSPTELNQTTGVLCATKQAFPPRYWRRPWVLNLFGSSTRWHRCRPKYVQWHTDRCSSSHGHNWRFGQSGKSCFSPAKV